VGGTDRVRPGWGGWPPAREPVGCLVTEGGAWWIATGGIAEGTLRQHPAWGGVPPVGLYLFQIG